MEEWERAPCVPLQDHPYPLGHGGLLLLLPLLPLGSQACFVLCKLWQFLQPPTTSILHSCFYLQDITGERGRGGL